MGRTIDRELVLRLAAQRAGFTESQVDALRRRDWSTLLAERTAAPADADVAPDLALAAADDPLSPAAGTPPDEDLRADLRRVSERLGVVRQQRDAALQVLRQLAARLGCCPRCWGTDASCPTCAGHGSPGHLPPDPRLRDWLEPALARADAARRDQASSTHPDRTAQDGPDAPPPTPADGSDPVPADPVGTAARTDGWA